MDSEKMEERAREVWRAAQNLVVIAHGRLTLGNLEGEELREAEEAYKDAVAECEAAKRLYDEIRRGREGNGAGAASTCPPKAC